MGGEAFNVEIVQRERIKPSSPTPQDLRIHELSILDQLALVIYIPIILFYPRHSQNIDVTINDKHHHYSDYVNLKSSLSKTLTLFYPLAGRIKQDCTVVECNDEGAELTEARVDHPMSEILERPAPDPEALRKLLAVDVESKEASDGALLHVQINVFACGGTAIGVSLSHKVADASTLSMFINTWAAKAKLNHIEVLPEFSSASLFPARHGHHQLGLNKELVREKCLMRRYVFDASSIAILKAKSACSSVESPTRVEAVSAVIWKCALGVSRAKFRGKYSSSNTNSISVQFRQDVNIRRRTSPPLPEILAGNLVGSFSAKHDLLGDHIADDDHDDPDDDVQLLVSELRKGFEEMKEDYSKGIIFGSEKMLKALKERRKYDHVVNCSSWCGFKFYEADFGWGLPFWVSLPSVALKNIVVLLDSRDGKGIEAWLTLGEDDVALLESNEVLRAFASFNPSVVS